MIMKYCFCRLYSTNLQEEISKCNTSNGCKAKSERLELACIAASLNRERHRRRGGSRGYRFGGCSGSGGGGCGTRAHYDRRGDNYYISCVEKGSVPVAGATVELPD